MKLAVGEFVVYGTHGVGRVAAREKKRALHGAPSEVVVLALEDGSVFWGEPFGAPVEAEAEVATRREAVIVTEAHIFPTDAYVAEGLARFAGGPAAVRRIEELEHVGDRLTHEIAEARREAQAISERTTRAAEEAATTIVGEARAKAERLESESKEKADRMEADARTRAEMLDGETAERRAQLFGELEVERDKLNLEVENLRSFEREYRSRLKSYFTQQLEALDTPGEATGTADLDGDDAGPKRLRSILGDDSNA